MIQFIFRNDLKKMMLHQINIMENWRRKRLKISKFHKKEEELW